MGGRLGMTFGMTDRGRTALAAAFIAAGCLTACSGGGLPPPSLATGGTPLRNRAQRNQAPRQPPIRVKASPFSDNTGLALVTRTVIEKPTLAEVMQPASTLPEMSLGRADAPVTIIKYASMTCPYCRQFQMDAFPTLKRDYIDTGKVRLILREFPIGFQSGAATLALRCVPEARYFQAYDKLMRQQAVWVSQEVRAEPILKVAAEVGLTREQFDACRADKGLVRELNAIKERGRTLGIVGTPNFFINGRLIKNTLTLKDIKAIIDPLLAART